MNGEQQFFGKYRGTVVDNVDPLSIGRIQVIVPDVSNVITSSWAMPCVPVAGKASGTYVVPQIGSGVWVEYEHGDPDYPIWVGCFWGSSAEVPPLVSAAPPGNPPIVITTTLQNSIVASDVPIAPMVDGGILLTSGASSIAISPTMVQIVSPTITINGALVVNDGAFAVAVV